MHVEEVHAAEDQEDLSDLHGQQLDGSLQADDRRGPQSQAREPEVHQVKPDEQEVVDGVGSNRVVVEGVQQERAPVLVQRVSHPDGQRDTQGKVEEIGVDHIGLRERGLGFEHVQLLVIWEGRAGSSSPFLNAFSYLGLARYTTRPPSTVSTTLVFRTSSGATDMMS